MNWQYLKQEGKSKDYLSPGRLFSYIYSYIMMLLLKINIKLFVDSKIKKGRAWWGARRLGSTKPTWLVSSCLDNLQRRLASDMDFSSQNGAISSCSRPQQHTSSNASERRGVGRAPECLSPQTCCTRPKREEADSLFGDHKTWGKMTADTCIPLSGHWCCLKVPAHRAQKTSERRFQRACSVLPGLEKQTESAFQFNSSFFHF